MKGEETSTSDNNAQGNGAARQDENTEPIRGFFDPRAPRKVEGIETRYPVRRTDWTSYDNITNNQRDGNTCHPGLHGHGFPTISSHRGIVGSENVHGTQISRRYRDASDSEWEACREQYEEHSQVLDRERDRSYNGGLRDRGRRHFSHGKTTDDLNPETSTRVPNSQYGPQTSRVQDTVQLSTSTPPNRHQLTDGRSTGHWLSTRSNRSYHTAAAVGERRRNGPNTSANLRPKVSGPLYRKAGTYAEKNNAKPIRRLRQNFGRDDFEQVCNGLFVSDNEENGNAPSTSTCEANSSCLDEDFLQARPTSLTSLCIDDFVNAPLDEMLFDRILRRGDKEYLDVTAHKSIVMFLAKNPLSSGALSVVVDMFEYPPLLISRPQLRLLRPVIIDGSAVAGCFDKEYSLHWGRIADSLKLTWNSSKILPMKPICLTLAMFLLRGHKVTVLLPNYYSDACKSEMRSKVDDVEALKVLINLQIVQFVKPKGVDSVIDAIRKEVDKVDALLISSGYSDTKEDWPKNPVFESHTLETRRTLPSAFTKASKRMLTPTFYGRNRDMTMAFGFHTKEDGQWRIVKEEQMCYYEPNLDSDSRIDDEGRLCQQLLFEDQIQLLVALKDLFEWPALYRRAIAAVLRLNYLATLAV